MAARLKTVEKPAGPLGAALAGIVAGLGLERLERQPGPEEVHDIRVGLKRFRALLALAKGAGEDEAVRELDALAAELKSEFAAARDEAVLRELAARLFGEEEGARLLGAGKAAGTGTGPRLARVRRLARELARRLRRVGGLPEPREREIERARERSLRRVIRRGERCAARPEDDEELHEWRKRVKTLLYQCELEVGRRPGRGARDMLRRLGRALGAHHDLSLLEARLRGLRPLPEGALRVARREKKRAARKALRLGGRLPETLPGGEG